MSNGLLGSWSTLNASREDIASKNVTDPITPQDSFDHNRISDIILFVLLSVISIFGLMGNGTVIWFLGFCMKRNPFTTFILHLAVADLMCLSSLSIMNILDFFRAIQVFVPFLFFYTYNMGQYLLTAISMDRCVSVVFPLWHRCHRPPHFSTLVCALIWIISFLITVSFSIFIFPPNALFYLLLVNAILCLPLMTVSTLVLFIKVYFRSQQRKKGKALTAFLLALLFFLFLAFPFTCILLIQISRGGGNNTETFLGLLCSCLNSSVNPLIYFLVGRKKHS